MCSMHKPQWVTENSPPSAIFRCSRIGSCITGLPLRQLRVRCTCGAYVRVTEGELQAAEVTKKTPAALPPSFAAYRRACIPNLRASNGIRRERTICRSVFFRSRRCPWAVAKLLRRNSLGDVFCDGGSLPIDFERLSEDLVTDRFDPEQSFR